MNYLAYNFKGNNFRQKSISDEDMNNEHLNSCEMISEEITCHLTFTKLFNGNIYEQYQILNILYTNFKHFETLTEAQ